MMLLRRLCEIAVLSLVCGVSAFGQGPSTCPTGQDSGAPCIDKIDPPGWWAGLPDPMLLVHGQSLQQAKFTLQGEGVTLTRTQSSANGHWAFLWIQSESAAAQTLRITAANDQGASRWPFTLAQRSRDPAAHRGFSSADVLYLIMTDRFARGAPSNNEPGDDRSAPRGWHGGDFSGILQHLDYLQQLGVTTLWTTPVESNGSMPESYHGYAATDLYAVDSHFGTLDDYRRLSDALHSMGMKLVIDLVPNHIGVQHPWVLDPPTPDWFHGTLSQHSSAKHDFFQLVDPHAPPAAWRDITQGWFSDAMPDLNQENPLVSRYLIQNAIWWVEIANLDGIRLDTFPYVDRAFWHDFHSALHNTYPQLTTVGEIFHRSPEVTSFFAGGVAHRGIDTGLDTPFDFPIYFTLRDVLCHGKPMTSLASVLRQDALYPHPERLVPFLGNHDTVRFLTEAGGSVPTVKLGLGLVITLRGTPQIYSGDEIGMAGKEDPDNRHDFPGGFAGDSHSAFTKTGRSPDEEEIFSWTSNLLALRRAHPVLQTGLEQNLIADEDVFAFVRSPDGIGCPADHSTDHSLDQSKERFLIVVNKGKQSKRFQLPMEDTALAGCTAFDSALPNAAMAPSVIGGRLQVEVPSESMSVYRVQ